jgi:hypothetical protein
VTLPAPNVAVVDIDLDAPVAADPGDAAAEKYRKASLLADSDEPQIKALTQRALQGVPGTVHARMDALRAAVGRHLNRKDLASGFASATEAVASRSGDCSEHSLLLAACLRAAGIPSRVVAGLMYVDSFADKRNVYGWHMWTQALVDGAWVDVDAVLSPDGPRFNVGHLAVVTGAADSASLDPDVANTVSFLGELQIELVSIDGKPVAKKPSKKAAPKARGVPVESDQ